MLFIFETKVSYTRILNDWKVLIKDLGKHVGEEVTLKGWLYNKRSSGKIKFLILRDGTGLLQCVFFKGSVPEEVFETADKIGQESSIEVSGKVKIEPRAPGGFELDASNLKIISEAHDYPITPKEHGIEFLMDNRHLWLRSSRQVAIMRIRHRLVKAIRDFFDNKGFTLMDPPILTPAACEGTSTLFETEYFDLGKAYLTQSGQLYAEAGAMALGKVYTFGPTFRAEKSKTRRHLTEFWMVEPEVAFADLNDDMDLAEEFLEYIVQTILKEREEELKVLERNTTLLQNVKRPLPRISYDEAVEILKKGGIIIYPTDTVYGIGCDIFNKDALEKIFSIKNDNNSKLFSFVCSSLKDISNYAKVSDFAYRTMKHLLPGPYTFILPAAKQVPKKLWSKRKTVGIRVPNHSITRTLVEE